MTIDSAATALVADIGGTHCRLALTPLAGIELTEIVQRRCADYPDLESIIDEFLAGRPLPDVFCLAVPGPAHAEVVTLVNNPWRRLDTRALRQRYRCPLYLLNDFAAQAHSLPLLQEADLDWWRPRGAPPGLPRAIVGPGTGLGAAALTADGRVLASEAGHMSFAPNNATQRRLLEAALSFLPRVYNEALVSGPGLGNLYRALQLLQGHEAQLDAEAIGERARQGDEDCVATLNEFSSLLGAICGDLALAYGAVGGMYLSGGLLGYLDELFDRPAFLDAFAAKGAYRDYCLAIPVARITHPAPGLLGAARFARLQLMPDTA